MTDDLKKVLQKALNDAHERLWYPRHKIADYKQRVVEAEKEAAAIEAKMDAILAAARAQGIDLKVPK